VGRGARGDGEKAANNPNIKSGYVMFLGVEVEDLEVQLLQIFSVVKDERPRTIGLKGGGKILRVSYSRRSPVFESKPILKSVSGG
jgi:hypothetical protein